EAVNILTAMAENQRIVATDPGRKAIALAWLFHLVGDIYQPLHTAQSFTVEYPQGDRGGKENCIRGTQGEPPMDLHRFWDGVITSSQNLTRLRNEATAPPSFSTAISRTVVLPPSRNSNSSAIRGGISKTGPAMVCVTSNWSIMLPLAMFHPPSKTSNLAELGRFMRRRHPADLLGAAASHDWLPSTDPTRTRPSQIRSGGYAHRAIDTSRGPSTSCRRNSGAPG